MCKKLIRISRLYRTTDKSKLAEVWGVDRASAVFLRVHGDTPHFIPLQYGCGYIFMIGQPPTELSKIISSFCVGLLLCSDMPVNP